MELIAVFVGKPRTVTYNGRAIDTGIFKSRLTGPALVRHLNVEGDQQADLSVHGGPDKAVYCYPAEHYEWWKTKRPDLDFEAGVFGENLAISGFDEHSVCIGDEWEIGSVRFAVTSPRMPCFKLGIKMGDPGIIREFMEARRTGFYLKVLREGTLEAGDVIVPVHRDGHGLTVDEVVRLYSVDKSNADLLQKAVSAPGLPPDWRDFFQQKLDKLSE